MNEKLARWRPFANHRLRLELFEERWTLGGAGFLDAPLGLVGVAVLAGTNQASESTESTEASASTSAAVRISGSHFPINFAATSPIGIEWQHSGASSVELFGPGSTTHAALSDLTAPLGMGSDESIVGTSDGFDTLDDSPGVSDNVGNLTATPANAANSAGAGEPLQANNLGTNTGSVSSSPNINLGVSNYAGSDDSLNAAITRSSSSIAEGGFAASNPNLIGSHGGFYLTPVSEAMIAEGIADPNVPRITALNRNAATMMGGWNPALRSIMVMDDGSRWFAAEQGTDVGVNSTMIYYRLGQDGWKAAGSVLLPPGIQQNMATVTDGSTIYSYGITAASVIETRFHTDKLGWNLNTGNNLVAGSSAIRPGANSNYVGAAWHNEARVVWWTSVGTNGSGGQWSYSFNRGNGWKTPIVSGLGGFNDVGYVRAQFDDESRLRLIGESYRGHYPFGEKYLFSSTLTLGKPATWATVLQQTAFTPLDIWQEGSSTASQNLYRTRTDQIGYSFGLGSAVESQTFAALDGRFIASKDRFGLVLSYGNFLEVRVVDRSAATGFIDWNAIEPTRIGFPKTLGTAGLSAIWNVDPSKQPNESKQLEFAIGGAYPEYDHLVYHYTVN